MSGWLNYVLTFISSGFVSLVAAKIFNNTRNGLEVKKLKLETAGLDADFRESIEKIVKERTKVMQEEITKLRDLCVDNQVKHSEELESYTVRLADLTKALNVTSKALEEEIKIRSKCLAQLSDQGKTIAEMQKKIIELENQIK